MINHLFFLKTYIKVMKNIIKGFIIGIGKIIPGVSGSMLAISLGVYYKVLEIIADAKKIAANIKFLFLLIIGFLTSISIFSNTVKWLLDIAYFPIMLLFIGLIIGGMPDILNEIKGKKHNLKNIIILILSLTFCYTLSNLNSVNLENKNNIFVYILLGLIEAFSSIVPGISGTAIYMSLGCYDMMLDFFSNIFNLQYLSFTLFFTIGLLTGTIILAKTITFLLKKYKTETFFAILGFMIASIIIMFQQAFASIKWTINGEILLYVLSVLLIFLGYKITIKINHLLAKP